MDASEGELAAKWLLGRVELPSPHLLFRSNHYKVLLFRQGDSYYKETGSDLNPWKGFPCFELCNVSLQVMFTWKARLTKRLKSPSRRMHPFPCSALLACFGNTRENAPFDQPSAADTHSTIYVQPTAKADQHPSHSRGEEGTPEKRRDSGIHSERNGSTNLNSSIHSANQPAETPEDSSGSLEGKSDCEAITFQTSIPRPSIIEMPTVSFPNAVMEGMVLEKSSDHLVDSFRKQTWLILLANKMLRGTLSSKRKCVNPFKFS